MDITEDQMPPTPDGPSSPEKGIPPRQEPDTGPGPDFNNPEPDEEDEPVDPLPDMDPERARPGGRGHQLADGSEAISAVMDRYSRSAGQAGAALSAASDRQRPHRGRQLLADDWLTLR
jgi:hypothetical protein